jgi:hypothetical protein
MGNRFQYLMQENSRDQSVNVKSISFFRQLDTWYFIRFMRYQRISEYPQDEND